MEVRKSLEDFDPKLQANIFDHAAAESLMILFLTCTKLNLEIGKYVNKMLFPFSYSIYESSPYHPARSRSNKSTPDKNMHQAGRMFNLSVTFRHAPSIEVILCVYPELIREALMRKEAFLNILWTSNSQTMIKNLDAATIKAMEMRDIPVVASTIKKISNYNKQNKKRRKSASFFETQETAAAAEENKALFEIKNSSLTKSFGEFILICCDAKQDYAEDNTPEIQNTKTILLDAAKRDEKLFHQFVTLYSDEEFFKQMMNSFLANDKERICDKDLIQKTRKNYFWYLGHFIIAYPEHVSSFTTEVLEKVTDTLASLQSEGSKAYSTLTLNSSLNCLKLSEQVDLINEQQQQKENESSSSKRKLS